MRRTLIILTDDQQEALKTLAERLGHSQNDNIRMTLDQFVVKDQVVNRRQLLRQAYGIWKDRDDLPDYETLRAEFDRQ